MTRTPSALPRVVAKRSFSAAGWAAISATAVSTLPITSDTREWTLRNRVFTVPDYITRTVEGRTRRATPDWPSSPVAPRTWVSFVRPACVMTLEEVIQSHYAQKGRAVHVGKKPNPLRNPLINGFDISDRQLHDLVEFLKSLTDESFIRNPKFSDPWK